MGKGKYNGVFIGIENVKITLDTIYLKFERVLCCTIVHSYRWMYIEEVKCVKKQRTFLNVWF